MNGDRIYLAHPIGGLDYSNIMDYYYGAETVLQAAGYQTLCPMRGKAYLRNEKELRPDGYQQPVSTNHAIIERDLWMVQQSNIVLVDLSGAKAISVGCMMELAWAHLLRRHTIVVMEEYNVHRHAFVLEAADIVFENLTDAFSYLRDLNRLELTWASYKMQLTK